MVITMELLNYDTLKSLEYNGYVLKNAPEKVLQFGEGNFLRAFVDYYFDIVNEQSDWKGKCVLVQPIESGISNLINAQDGLYTLYLYGKKNNQKIERKRIISSVSRCLNPYSKNDYSQIMTVASSDDLEIIVSNTTEAGIQFDPSCQFNDCPPTSFPAKLTQVLYQRFISGKSGIIVLSCELIDNNGQKLQKCVNQYISLWQLDDSFYDYINSKCVFCSTLVDRIVPGRINDKRKLKKLEDENGYIDNLIDVGELFGLWIIEGDKEINDKLPFQNADLGHSIRITDNLTPYKIRKVRVLNGAHTSFSLGAYLCGFTIVRECMQDKIISSFINKIIYDEIIPTLSQDGEELISFAEAIEDRFDNPFIDHELMSISLNSTSKWKTRNLPSLLNYVKKFSKLPICLTTSLALYIAFYSNNIVSLDDNGLLCKRDDGNEYVVKDDKWILDFYFKHRNDNEAHLVENVLANKKMWDIDLTNIDKLTDTVISILKLVHQDGTKNAFENCLGECE